MVNRDVAVEVITRQFENFMRDRLRFMDSDARLDQAALELGIRSAALIRRMVALTVFMGYVERISFLN